MSAIRKVQARASKKREVAAREAKKRIALMKQSPEYAEPSFNAADAGLFVDEDGGIDFTPPSAWRKRKVVLGLFLVPICMVTVLTLLELFFRATVDGKFWKSEGFWFFAFGCGLWFMLGWLRMQPAWLYVFAHEFTHAITARLSGGKVSAMHVSETGGYIETDKSNVLISLSPYLIPLYTMVIFALYGLLSVTVDMHRDVIFTLPLLGWVVWVKWVWAIYFLVGLTWCFHLTFTVEALRMEQSDLVLNGEFFSIMLIFVGNLALIGALFIAASPTVSFADVWADARGLVMSVWLQMRGMG